MPSAHEVKAPNRRLDSWKEIAAFFDRDERTVKRWEKERLLPVHRLPGGSRARVYAFTEELERWMRSPEALPEEPAIESEIFEPPESSSPVNDSGPIAAAVEEETPPPPISPSRKTWTLVATCVVLSGIAVVAMVVVHRRHAAALAVSASGSKAARHAANAEAEELYLQGRYYWNKRTPEDLNKAVDSFTQAIVHDPNYAPAYVGLADCYNLLREFAAMPSKEAFPRALAAAQKAVELDDSSAEAHATLAFVTFYWKWDIAEADREFRRAIALNPDYGAAHHWYANFLGTLGRNLQALNEMNIAEKIDPGSSAIMADRALLLYNMGRQDEAIARLQQIESSQPSFYSTHRYLSYIYLDSHDYPKYLKESMDAANLSQDEQQLEIARGAEEGYKSGGEHGMLVKTAAVEQKLYDQGRISPYLLAVAYARLGDKPQTLRYLQTAYNQHDPEFISTRHNHALIPFRNDPTFRQLELKAGLPPLT
jgi:tetratricopeptide (TPR) repeat protein